MLKDFEILKTLEGNDFWDVENPSLPSGYSSNPRDPNFFADHPPPGTRAIVIVVGFKKGPGSMNVSARVPCFDWFP